VDTHTLVDIITLVIAVLGGYLGAARGVDSRLAALETKIAVILDRDRRRRLEDYEREDGLSS
jgi:hypothetical protein